MKKTIDLFVPGRLCLFGEHSDWAGRYSEQNAEILPGEAIVTGINLGLYAKVSADERFVVESLDADGNQITCDYPMKVDILKDAALNDEFFSYCCGVAAYMRENYSVSGLHVHIYKNTLPIKKGLSSSAAICVLIAKAFNLVYGLSFSTKGIMRIAYCGERLTKSRCGRLDQACAYGNVPVLMNFSGDEINVSRLHVGKTLYWVIVDLHAHKNTRKILTHLNHAYPFAQDEIEKNVQDALGKENIDIVTKAIQCIDEGDDVRLGRLMNDAQELFDKKIAPACPDELSSPVLHSLLNDKNIQKWVLGRKGVGSQGDGSAQFLLKDRRSQMEFVKYIEDVRKMTAYPFEIKAGGTIRKAIVPVAGFGTRMYPETHFIKKAFLPIIDKDNVVKPVLLCILEELDQAGIEEIYLIVSEEEKEEYKKFFEYETDSKFGTKLPTNVAPYYEYIKTLGQKIRLVVQNDRKGFGHAVYQAYKYVKKEPALLMLGDFIYRSDLTVSCTQQTMNAYNKSGGRAIVSIKEIPLEEVVHYGVVNGEFTERRNYMMHVNKMSEKPSVDYASANLMNYDEKHEKKYYATFGQYVLTPEIFEVLGKKIEEMSDSSKEIDLTFALNQMAEEEKLDAVVIAGKSFDVGIPSAYKETFINY